MKQVIEIEVPKGMNAVWENGTIKYVPNNWKEITTFEKALTYVWENLLPSCEDLLKSYNNTIPGSFEYKIACYRIVVAALTNNEKRHLTTGDRWYPIVQFCSPKDIKHCIGNVIGIIESEGMRYCVMGGCCSNRGGGNGGLGCLSSLGNYSCSYATIGIRSVSSQEIAEHISTYFGKLLFEIHYGGTNCDWKWVD